MPKIFKDFDLANFWEDSEYARERYVESPPTPEMIQSIEKELGYRLPAAYIELMQDQNGGVPRNTCYPTKSATSWADDHVAITGVMGIGRTKTYSLCGDLGSKFMQEEWGYPEFGICICDCPSAGHDMIMLDYRKCGPEGEPQVVHVDQEDDYRVTGLAKNVETFIRGLVHESVYDMSADDLKRTLAAIDTGSFSTLLKRLMAACPAIQFESILRSICRQVAVEKGHFSLHADEKSELLYDVQFFLYTHSHPVPTEPEYLAKFGEMLVFGDGDITTGGFAPGFLTNWFKKRRAAGEIIADSSGRLAFSPAFAEALRRRLQAFA